MPQLAIGTLRQGGGFLQGLSEPMARALFVHFLVAEVHPFNDGNGRLARLMMNSELVAAQQTRIIIPLRFRSEYLNGLNDLNRNLQPEAYICIMTKAQGFAAEFDFGNAVTANRSIW